MGVLPRSSVGMQSPRIIRLFDALASCCVGWSEPQQQEFLFFDCSSFSFSRPGAAEEGQRSTCAGRLVDDPDLGRLGVCAALRNRRDGEITWPGTRNGTTVVG